MSKKNREKKRQPWLIVIAGPNGAGKSTFYDLVLKDDPLLKNAEFVNLDNKAKELAGSDGDVNDYMLDAGRYVVDKINGKIKNRESFIYETTASGGTHLKVMDNAAKNGFKVATVFIGLSNVVLSAARVNKRVKEGGHNVPYEDIIRRYPKIIKRFPDMLARSDVAAVFDNSTKNPYKLIFLMDDRAFRVFYKYPKWLDETVKKRKTRKEFINIYDSNDLHSLQKNDINQIIENILIELENKDPEEISSQIASSGSKITYPPVDKDKNIIAERRDNYVEALKSFNASEARVSWDEVAKCNNTERNQDSLLRRFLSIKKLKD